MTLRLPSFCLGVMLVLAGCAGSVQTAWVRDYGGCVDDNRLVRLRAAAERLDGVGLDPQKLHVLNCPCVDAYSWASGDVYVAAGLVDAATDDELVACLAHEVGHLVNEYKVLAPAGLGGQSVPPNADIEIQADSTALACLRHARVPADALVSLLQRMAARDPSLRQALRSRIAAIRGIGSPA